MALTRNLLKSLGLTEEQVGAVIEAHSETVEGLRARHADELAAVTKERDQLKADDWQKKYNDEHEAFENFKADREKSDHANAVRGAYEKLLEEAGIVKTSIPAVLKVSDLSAIELNKDGTLKGADALKAGIVKEWSGFIGKETNGGVTTPTPAPGAGMSKADILKIADPVARQAAIRENINLFSN